MKNYTLIILLLSFSSYSQVSENEAYWAGHDVKTKQKTWKEKGLTADEAWWAGYDISVSEKNVKKGLTQFEKAKMIPDNLNSMMLICESECDKEHEFESKAYQACYKDCLGGRVSSSSELHGCEKHTNGQSISCPDGVYIKSSSLNEDLNIHIKDDVKSNGKSKRKANSVIKH